MADAVIFLAIVLFTIAASADVRFYFLLLFFSCLGSIFSFVILTSIALADSWPAGKSLLEADAVELTALALLAVTFPTYFKVEF